MNSLNGGSAVSGTIEQIREMPDRLNYMVDQLSGPLALGAGVVAVALGAELTKPREVRTNTGRAANLLGKMVGAGLIAVGGTALVRSSEAGLNYTFGAAKTAKQRIDAAIDSACAP